jgi:hypothetical protein
MSASGSCAALAALLLFVLGSAARPAGAEPVDGVFTASNGLSGPYRLVVPDEVPESLSLGLLVFFHPDGDTATFRERADGFAERGRVSRLAVAALSVPRTDATDGSPPPDPADRCWWAPREASNAAYVDEWIQTVAAGALGARLDDERVIFAGVSGGGDFASALNVQLGHRYRGGAVAVCGGDLPRQDGGSCVGEPVPDPLDPLPAKSDVPDGATRTFRYSFDLTRDDPLLAFASEARAYYRGLGFPAALRKPRGSGHCGFDAPAEEILDERIAAVASWPSLEGCREVDLTLPAAAIADPAPLAVAEAALPEGDPERAARLAAIAADLDGAAALAATFPPRVDRCRASSPCPKAALGATVRGLRAHLVRIDDALAEAIARNGDAAVRRALREDRLASHRAKKAALRQVPANARLCAD